jgi:hypothetical protein
VEGAREREKETLGRVPKSMSREGRFSDSRKRKREKERDRERKPATYIHCCCIVYLLLARLSPFRARRFAHLPLYTDSCRRRITQLRAAAVTTTKII